MTLSNIAPWLTAGFTLAAIIAVTGCIARLRIGGWMQSRQPKAHALALLETIALDPRRRLHLVRCGHRHVVLLTGPGQDTVVGWMQEP